jgi:hypothetical protein
LWYQIITSAGVCALAKYMLDSIPFDLNLYLMEETMNRYEQGIERFKEIIPGG